MSRISSASFGIQIIYLELTLSFPGGPLGGHLAVAIHISPNNGPIEMIPSGKLVVDVLAIHCTL